MFEPVVTRIRDLAESIDFTRRRKNAFSFYPSPGRTPYGDRFKFLTIHIQSIRPTQCPWCSYVISGVLSRSTNSTRSDIGFRRDFIDILSDERRLDSRDTTVNQTRRDIFSDPNETSSVNRADNVTSRAWRRVAYRRRKVLVLMCTYIYCEQESGAA